LLGFHQASESILTHINPTALVPGFTTGELSVLQRSWGGLLGYILELRYSQAPVVLMLNFPHLVVGQLFVTKCGHVLLGLVDQTKLSLAWSQRLNAKVLLSEDIATAEDLLGYSSSIRRSVVLVLWGVGRILSCGRHWLGAGRKIVVPGLGRCENVFMRIIRSESSSSFAVKLELLSVVSTIRGLLVGHVNIRDL